MAQRRGSREQWRRLVDGWPRSGLTQQAYCERHAVSVGSLRRWRQVLREEREAGRAGHVAKPEPVRLVPVKLIGGAVAEAMPLTLLLSDGMRIEIPCGFDAPTLKRLLGLLRAAP